GGPFCRPAQRDLKLRLTGCGACRLRRSAFSRECRNPSTQLVGLNEGPTTTFACCQFLGANCLKYLSTRNACNRWYGINWICDDAIAGSSHMVRSSLVGRDAHSIKSDKITFE